MSFRRILLGVSTREISKNWVGMIFQYFGIIMFLWILEKEFYQIRGRSYQNRIWYNKKLRFQGILLGVSTRQISKNWARMIFLYFWIIMFLWILEKGFYQIRGRSYRNRIWYDKNRVFGEFSRGWGLVHESKSAQQITCLVTFIERQITFYSTFVYAFNTPLQRLDLWKELISLSSVSIPWCVVGDFNSILHLNEVSGGREQWTSDMQAFSDCVNSASLDHIHTLGNLFTWQNNCPQNLIHKRLDKALGNKHWFYDFSEAISLVKPRGLMDHCPIIISVPMSVQTFPKPFQYFHFMSNIQGFHSTVAES